MLQRTHVGRSVVCCEALAGTPVASETAHGRSSPPKSIVYFNKNKRLISFKATFTAHLAPKSAQFNMFAMPAWTALTIMKGYDSAILLADQPAMLKLAALAAVTALMALHADAQVFRCTDERTRKVVYSDTPCQGGTAGGAVKIQENTLDTSGSREQALHRELQDLRQRMDSYESNASRPAYGRTESDLQAERADSRECQQAKRSLEIEAGSMSRSKPSVEAKTAAMRSACGIREPDRVEINNNYGRPSGRQRPQTSVTRTVTQRGAGTTSGTATTEVQVTHTSPVPAAVPAR